MASYLKALSPIPSFPEYTGPHRVGTIDVEIPVSELDSPSPSPDESIRTVQFRIFYPCESDAKPNATTSWLPSPQRDHVAAYTRFLGARSMLAEVISFFPRLLHYISIPVRKNAPLLQPTTPTDRWPVMVFSHGLGGFRNAYSHLAGSIASHGVIVIAPEHRDGSAPLTLIRRVPTEAESTSEKSNTARGHRRIDYMRVSHTPSPEVEAARNTQLKVRLWELGCIHNALLKMDQTATFTNLNTSSIPLSLFSEKMAIHEPGSISWAGHSFGAATVAQFVKSVYYSPQNSTAPADYEPLFTPSSRSAIANQITPNSPIILLDIWCLALRAASTRWLWDKAMPCYSRDGPGGCGVLAIESQAFVKWRVHLKATKRFLSPDPSSDGLSKAAAQDGRAPPHFYYATASAHLSQSDFGILFPWVVKRVFQAEEPERVMRLNVRAILQLLRERGLTVAATSAADMELESGDASTTANDVRIFGQEKPVRGWHLLTTDVSDLDDVDFEQDSRVDTRASPSEAVVAGEILEGERPTSGGRAEVTTA
ncbi:MAG: hypothetical protein M1818_004574 [Claussenomyces sp. TS43310]|nr:MAG: hypothetical protein M1818_004574 [Claussenomyces sp. TS43310]